MSLSTSEALPTAAGVLSLGVSTGGDEACRDESFVFFRGGILRAATCRSCDSDCVSSFSFQTLFGKLSHSQNHFLCLRR